MKAIKRRWTFAEKSLFLAPLLIAIGAVALQFGPNLGRQILGLPQILTTESNNNLRFLRISLDGKVLVATGTIGGIIGKPMSNSSGTIYLWDANTLKPLPSISPPLTRGSRGIRIDASYGIALSPDGEQLSYEQLRRQFTVFNLKTRRIVWTKQLRGKQADFSPDGERIAVTGPSFGQNSILNASNGKVLKSWKKLDNDDGLVSWSLDGRFLAYIGDIVGRDRNHPGHGGKIELRDQDGRKLRELGSDFTKAFHFSPDGKQLVSVGEIYQPGSYVSGHPAQTGFVRCFNTTSNTLIWERAIRGKGIPSEIYRDAVFSPDGKTVAVHAVISHQVLILDGKNGREMRRLPIRFTEDTRMAFPHSLAFSPDGKGS